MTIANAIDSKQTLKPGDTPSFQNVKLTTFPAAVSGRVLFEQGDQTIGHDNSFVFNPGTKNLHIGTTNFVGSSPNAVSLGGASNESNADGAATIGSAGSKANAENSSCLSAFGGICDSAYGSVIGGIGSTTGSGNAHISIGNNQGGTFGNNDHVCQISSNESVTYGSYSVTLGGAGNILGVNGSPTANHSWIGAGYLQKVFGDNSAAVYGSQCTSTGSGSAVLGYRADALHDATAVWNLDHTFGLSGISSTAAGQFILAASAGIGFGAPPVDSAYLSITSTTKGFLPPVMTDNERLDISSPAEGLNVFDSTSKLPYWFNGTSWITLDGSNEGSFNQNWIGAFSGSSIINYQINGSYVTLDFLNLSGIAAASSIIISGISIAANLRPISQKTVVISVTDNSSNIFGLCTINPTGSINIGTGPGGSAFTGAGVTGFSSFSISYSTV
jgi:hypothetical protein